MNYGEQTFASTEIEVISNGVAVDIVIYNANIPYADEEKIYINITENLQLTNNEIVLNLLNVNGQEDVVIDNNVVTVTLDLGSTYDIVTLVINADNFPEETSY